MRNELEQIEMIIAYLRDSMSAEEKADFEKRLKTDNELANELDIQRNMIEGMKRAELKMATVKAKTSYTNAKILKTIVIAVGTAAVVAAVVWGTMKLKTSDAGENESMIETIQPTILENESVLPLQVFIINPKRDTVIETTGGMVVAIPENCFESGSENIQIEIREAFQPADIMKAGLSTFSSGQLLETGGMFFISAKSDQQELTMKKEIIAEIPAGSIRENMQIYDGVKGENKEINWVNPKPVEIFLNNVDVMELDFYPPGYISELKKMKLDYQNKTFTDSLYYSLELEEAQLPVERGEEIVVKDDGVEHDGESVLESNSIQRTDRGISIYYDDLFLKPSQVRTIWNKLYNQTLVATKEFEERLAHMHKSCTGNVILKMYLDNMNEPLWKLDSIAAKMSETTYSDFKKLSQQKTGRVRPNEGLFAQLKAYYETTQEQYSEVAKKVRQDYLKREEEARQKATEQKIKHNNVLRSEVDKTYQQEWNMNFNEACRQLGYKKVRSPLIERYAVTITSPGWKNLDRAVTESLISRTTLNYQDPNTGKTARIEYTEATVIVDNMHEFDKVYVYLLPDEFNSYIRMNRIDNSFRYNLNELLNYKMVAVGYKGDETGIYEIKRMANGETHIKLVFEPSEKVAAIFQSISKKSGSDNFGNELDYLMAESKEIRRLAAFNIQQKQREQVWRVVYPCGFASSGLQKKEIVREVLK